MADKARPRGRPMHLMAISDTELLAIVDDLADENGWTPTLEVRLQLGEQPDAISGVGSRIGWMRRYGWLEKHRDDGTHRLTAMGHAILDNPRLAKPIETALAKANPAQRVALVRELGEGAAKGPDEIHTALRRQFRRSSFR